MKKADIEIGAEYARTPDGKLSGYHAERVRVVGFVKADGALPEVVEVVILEKETGEPKEIDFITSEPRTSFFACRQIVSPWPEFVEHLEASP